MYVHSRRLLKNINISVGARNLGEKDFKIMPKKKKKKKKKKKRQRATETEQDKCS